MRILRLSIPIFVASLFLSLSSDGANVAKLKQQIEKITRGHPGDIGLAIKR